jgi:polysaccharide biosynthesis/export protein
MSKTSLIVYCLLGSAAFAQQQVTPIGPELAPQGETGSAGLRTLTSGLNTVSANLVIGPGDLLGISVFDTPELTQETRVSNSGAIEYPLLGSVNVMGMTAPEAAHTISTLLRKGDFVRDAQISISIKEYATQGVSLLGEVRRPGSYPAMGTHTLLDYITAAGGLTVMANRTVTITHKGNPEPSTYTIDTHEGQSWKVNPLVESGDRVEVGRAGVVYVLGEVGKPGGFVVGNGERLTVLKAIALAGGHKRTATLSKARLIRKTESGTEETPVSVKTLLAGKQPDIELRDNDVLFIPGNEAKTLAIRTLESMVSAVGYSAIYAAR